MFGTRDTTGRVAARARILVDRLFADYDGPPICVELWEGSRLEYGSGEAAATVLVRDAAVLGRVLAHSSELTLAEAYLEDWIDIQGDVEAAVAAGEAALTRAAGLRKRLALAQAALALGAELRRQGRNGADEAAAPAMRAVRPHAARVSGRLHSPERDRAAVRHH